MAFETNYSLQVVDNKAAAGANTDSSSNALRIHEDAYQGLKGSQQSGDKLMLDYFKQPETIIIIGGGEGQAGGNGKVGEVTDKDRDRAETKIEKGLSKLIPEADRATITAMTSAITHGDAKAFGEAVKKAGGDPEKLRKLVAEVDKMLEAQGSLTKLDVTADGKVLVSDPLTPTALAFNPATGRAEGRRVEHNVDGSMTVQPGEVLHANLDDAFKSIGDNTVTCINVGGLGKLISPIIGDGQTKEPLLEPIKPWGGPFKPWNEPLKPLREPRFNPVYDPSLDGHQLPDWYKLL